MAYVSVPKDLTNIKTKFIGNFTKRQIVCFGLGILFGFPIYFLLKDVIGTTGAFYVLIVAMMPFFMFAMLEKNSMPLEKYLKYYFQHKYVNAPIRLYKSENIYDYYITQMNEAMEGENNGTSNTNKANGKSSKVNPKGSKKR